jgi:hypothetical protein
VTRFIDHLYTHDSELQAVTTPPLTSTIHKSPQHPLNPFQPAVFISRSLATASNSGDSSASRAQVLSLSHIATDGQSVCLSCCPAPSGAHDQMLVTVWQFLFCPWGRPLWREGGSVFCQSVSSNKSIVSMYSYIHFTCFAQVLSLPHAFNISARTT